MQYLQQNPAYAKDFPDVGEWACIEHPFPVHGSAGMWLSLLTPFVSFQPELLTGSPYGYCGYSLIAEGKIVRIGADAKLAGVDEG